MKVLTKQQFENWKESKNLVLQYEEDVTNRIEEVLNIFWGVFGAKVDYWYFEGADEGEIGDLNSHMNNDEIYGIRIGLVPLDPLIGSKFTNTDVPIGNDGPYNHVILDKEGNEFDWDGSIPTRWLFENCKDEIIKGKQAFEEKKALKAKQLKEVKQKLQAQQDKIVNDVLQKLSPEEVLALEKAFKNRKGSKKISYDKR